MKIRILLFLVALSASFSNQLIAQTNVSVATATLVNTFPYTETNVNSSGGDPNNSTNGGCNASCCASLVYRIEIPTYGSLRGDISNFTVLAGGMLAYTPDVPNPTSDNQLTYLNVPGNFCGFRDSLQLGQGYSWVSGTWIDPTIAGSIAPGTYYVLFWGFNQQFGTGANTDITFDFVPMCSPGFSCSSTALTVCTGDGYDSPAGDVYTTSGSYTDTLFGAALGGLDSLIFTELTIDHTAYTQDFIVDEELCPGTDSVLQSSYTEYVSYSDFIKADQNWVECNATIPALVGSNRSIFSWIKHPNQVSGSSEVIIGINTSSSGSATVTNTQIGTNEQFGLYDGANSHYSGVVVTDGLWHYVGYTYDNTTNETIMYVDGMPSGTYTNTQPVNGVDRRLSLGQEFDGGTASNFMDGLMTEVSIWDEVLDSTEISTIMNDVIENSHPKYSNLLAYYPMMTSCGADNTVIVDHSPNGNNGTASHDDIQILDNLEQIPSFDASAHYNKDWTVDGSTVATTDSLILETYAAGNYQLELSRDYFTITDDWVVTLNAACMSCTETQNTLSPTACDSYTSPSGNYTWTSSNTYMDTIPNAAGCDSVLTIILTVNNSTAGTDIQTACDTYTWIDGNTYTTTNNTATHVLTNAVGCDSTVTLNLTINYGTAETDVQSACDTYTWMDGNTYTASNNSATHVLTNAAGCDSTITLDLTINYSMVATDVQTACDSYTWIDGNTYTASNNSATHVLTSTAGCDSTVTLDLTINYSNSGTDVQIACDSYTWIDGNTYTASNTSATHILTNAAGCDSTVTLDLTINYSTTGTDVQTACDSYTWIDGNNYTASNTTATHALTNAAGCDSTVTLDLTINNSTTSTDVQTACDSYTWMDGNTYTASNNSATHVLTNAAGCDSTITLDLTINYSTSETDSQVACNSYTWIDGNTYATSNNSATHVLTNAAGCDSTVTLDLTINYSNSGTDVQIACDSYTWIDGNTYTASNTSATHILTNAAGCDSIVTLDLTINYSNSGTDVQTACDSYTWIDGNNYTASNTTATHVLTNTAGCDSTVTLDLTINYSTNGTDIQTACDSYTWIDGNNYTASNSSATHVLTNAAGCDSTVTLDLTINYSTAETDVQSACDTYTWIDGNTYTASNNTATHVLTNAAGCDSTITLDLTINYSTIGTDVQTACNSYTWIDGNNYTASNSTATHLLTNAAGCDSTVTLDLTINYSNSGTDVQTACDSYTWIDGNNYTASNTTATHVLTNAAGCDSTVTLDLIINYSTTGTDVQTACDSYTWVDGNNYTASNSSATHVLTNAAGCDSTVTLDLIINYSTTSTDLQTACDSYTWMDGNTYTASNSSATHVLTNAAGCDSTITLDLTINYSTTETDTQAACDTYTWIDGNTYTANNNTASVVLTSAAGCDSTITLDLTINIVDPTVTQSGLTLTANAVGATYQWIDCANGNIAITGETNQVYTATTNGEYAVEVTENGCTNTSTCIIIDNVGLQDYDSKISISAYPNPTTGQVIVTLDKIYTHVSAIVMDVTGKVISKKEFEEVEELDLNLTGPNGYYLLQLSLPSGEMTTLKIIKN